MHFAFICQDKPDHLKVRMDTRPEHVAYLESLNAKGSLAFAGPCLDAAGNPNGSLVVVEAADAAAAKAIADADPYAKAGLFASVDIRPWRWVFNAPA